MGTKVAKSHYTNEGYGEDCKGSKILFVGNLNFETTEKDLVNFFSQVGSVSAARLSYHPDGQAKGFAHVEFKSAASVDDALKTLQRKEIEGRVVRLDRAMEFTESEGSKEKTLPTEKFGYMK